jgi:hypothetical protein
MIPAKKQSQAMPRKPFQKECIAQHLSNKKYFLLLKK